MKPNTNAPSVKKSKVRKAKKGSEHGQQVMEIIGDRDEFGKLCEKYVDYEKQVFKLQKDQEILAAPIMAAMIKRNLKSFKCDGYEIERKKLEAKAAVTKLVARCIE